MPNHCEENKNECSECLCDDTCDEPVIQCQDVKHPYGQHTKTLTFFADSLPSDNTRRTPCAAQKRMEKAVDVFQRNIMKRCDCSLSAERLKAVSFFKKQFGIDFGSSENKIVGDCNDVCTREALRCEPVDCRVSHALLKCFATLPECRFHLYNTTTCNETDCVVTTSNCSTEQFEVREGGFCVVARNIWLYGLYGKKYGMINDCDDKKRRGVFVKNAKLVFGDFNLKNGPELCNDNDIVINYKTLKPLIRDFNGALCIEYDLWHEDWCEGIALGCRSNVDINCKLHKIIRLNLTFPNSIWPGLDCKPKRSTRECLSCDP